jgi:hypothetical protein
MPAKSKPPRNCLTNCIKPPCQPSFTGKATTGSFYTGKKGKKYVIADPGVGIRYLTREELIMVGGNGVMLLLEADDSRFSSTTGG